MTPKQQRFVEEYLVDLNGTRAAVRAGFSPHNALDQAYRLKCKPKVKAAIAAGIAERAQRTQIQADLVVTELARIAFADLRDTVVWGPNGVQPLPSESLSPDSARAIAEVSSSRNGENIRIKLFDKRAALETLARHLGLFPERRGGLEASHNLPPLRVIIAGEKNATERPDEAEVSRGTG